MSMSSRSGSSTSGTPSRPLSAISAVSLVREKRVHADIERELRHLLPEPARLLPPALGERDRHQRVAVHAPLDVERRLAVPGEDEEPHEHDEALVPLLAAGEAVQRERGEVERGLGADDELGEVLPTAGACWKPWPEKPGRVEEPPRLRDLADDGVVVGAHLVEAPPGRLDRQPASTGRRRVPRLATSSIVGSRPPKTRPAPSRWK